MNTGNIQHDAKPATSDHAKGGVSDAAIVAPRAAKPMAADKVKALDLLLAKAALFSDDLKQDIDNETKALSDQAAAANATDNLVRHHCRADPLQNL